MTKNEKEISEEEVTKKKKKTDVPLPFCRTAPSAEQARASDEDEPCDDARGKE